MKERGILLLLSALLVSVIASGCGTGTGSASNQKGDSEEKASQVQTEQTQKTAESESAPVTLTVWGWDASFNGKAFEEADKLDKDVTVNFVEMAKADALKKINTVLASGVTTDLPDIVIISDLNAQGYLMSYPDAFYPMTNEIKYSDFANYKKDFVSYKGISYGVPFDTGVAGLFYRSDYIKDAGYTDDDMQNLTWESYRKLGEKLKAKGHDLETYNPDDISGFQIMLQSAGKWYTKDDGSADFVNNDALKECYSNFIALNKADYVKKVSDWTGFAGAINGGDVACVIRGSWITSTIKAAKDQSGLWRLAPIPKMNLAGATQRSNQGGSSFFVLAKSAHPKEAAQFLAKTFGGSKDLYNTLASEDNIMGTYLPASDVEAHSKADDFFGGQKINQILSGWISEIPSVNPGAYTAEAQAALLAVTPSILKGDDLGKNMETAQQQFNQTIKQ